MRVLLLALMLFVWAPPPVEAVDVSGTWKLDVQLDAGSGTATFVFKQESEKVTGTYEGVLGKAEVTGTIKEDAIEFSFTAQELQVQYKGKVTDDSMEGTCEYGQLGSGTFKGKKQ